MFDAPREVEQKTRREPDRGQLDRVLARCDDIIAGLPANDESAAGKLRGLFVELPNPDSGKEAEGGGGRSRSK